MLPDFIIGGAQKSGTSWLMANLQTHPEIQMTADELHFFNKDSLYECGIAWYKKQFAGLDPEKRIGEKSPVYFAGNSMYEEEKDVIGRMHNHLPEVSLIYMLRNPVDRIISHLKHAIKVFSLPYDIDPDLMLDPEKKQFREKAPAPYGRGEYITHIRNLLEYYSREQLLVLVFEEDLIEDSEEGLKKTCRFLEVDDQYSFPLREKKINPSARSKLSLKLGYHMRWLNPALKVCDYVLPEFQIDVSQETRRKLREHYKPYNKELFEFLGREIPAWQ